MPFLMSWRPHLHTSSRSTPGALRSHWEIWALQEGIAVFNYLKFFGASPMSDMQMSHENTSPNHQEVAANVRGWHCGHCVMYLCPGVPQGLQRCFGNVPITGRWSWDRWIMARRQHCVIMFILLSSGCSVTPLPLPDVSGRRHAIAGRHLYQWSIQIARI